MNPLTAAQERAREEYKRVFGTDPSQHMSEALEAIVASTWNEAIEAAEGVVPVSRVGTHYKEAVNDYGMIDCSHWNVCRTEILQALSKLKQP